MQKTWNVTLYRDGKPVSERHGVSHSDAVAQIYRLARTTAPVELVGVSHSDAVAQIYRLARTTAPVELVEESAAPETGELELVAA